MIREGKKIPSDVKENIPVIVEKLSPDREITALYVFGSLAKGILNPLSDLDFGILLSGKLTKSKVQLSGAGPEQGNNAILT